MKLRGWEHITYEDDNLASLLSSNDKQISNR